MRTVQTLRLSRTENFEPKRMSGTSDEQFQKEDDLARLREEQWRWAREQVVPWGELQGGLEEDDYNFGSWARGKELLRAGCVYEYARESQKLRCLLVLINAAFEKARQAEESQKQSRPFHGLQFLSLSFEGLRYKDALLQLGGWFGWLRNFTNELADNTSFADLNQKRVSESLDTLPRYFDAPGAVELAIPGFNDSFVEPRLLSPAQALDVHHRNIENDVVITIRIRLRDFTNKEIGDAMEVLASMLRPSTEKEPTRRGTGKRDSPRSWLNALSVMRLASHYPKTLPLPSEFPRRDRRKRPHGAGTAVSKFNAIRLGGISLLSTKRKIIGGDLGHNEFDRYAARGRKQFLEMFPFGERAANALTWAQRQRKGGVV